MSAQLVDFKDRRYIMSFETKFPTFVTTARKRVCAVCSSSQDLDLVRNY